MSTGYSALGSLMLNNSQAALQLEQLKRQRDAEQAAALNQALSTLGSGVIGGLSLYQNAQDKQAQMGMEQQRISNEKDYQSSQLKLAQDTAARQARAQALDEAQRYQVPGLVQQDPTAQAQESTFKLGRDYSAAGSLDPSGMVPGLGTAGMLGGALKATAKQLDDAADTHVAMVGRDAAIPDIQSWHTEAATEIHAAHPEISVDEAKAMLLQASHQNQLEIAARHGQQEREDAQNALTAAQTKSADANTAATPVKAQADLLGGKARQTEAAAAYKNALTNEALVPSKVDKNEAAGSGKTGALSEADRKADIAATRAHLDSLQKDLENALMYSGANDPHTQDLIKERSLYAGHLTTLLGLDGSASASAAAGGGAGSTPAPIQPAPIQSDQVMVQYKGQKLMLPRAQLGAALQDGAQLIQ